VRAAPWYHQFDAYRGRWVSNRLFFGNGNPVQRVKLGLAYKRLAKLGEDARAARTSVGAEASEIERILDLARWAPSGDNTQPWRFDITDSEHVTVHVRDQADDDVYDYNGGQPSLLSAGMLLETTRIAASGHGRLLWWDHRSSSGHDHIIDVALRRAAGVVPDPLLPFVTSRSVDRRPFRVSRLTADRKAALAAALGQEFALRWFEKPADRWRMARVNGLATDVRLRIPEAFRVHRRILDWNRRFSPTGIPKEAVGLDALTLKLMHWAMQDWGRMERLNALPGGTLLARLQMDYLPGIACAAHFAVVRKDGGKGAEGVPALLRAGQALQRFWLTATRLGLAMQPSMAAVIFGFYGRRDIAFTHEPKMRAAAKSLAARLNEASGVDPDALLFLGRLGEPRSRRVKPRSVRRPLEQLLLPRNETAPQAVMERDRAAV
jgi:nitroreductase